MIKTFFKDSFIYSISGIVSRGISLILLPVYTRIFTTADYGLIDYITVIGNLVAVTVALEITQGMARYYAEAQTDDEKKGYSSTALWFTVITYMVFLFFVILFRSYITRELLGEQVNEWVSVLAATTFTISAIVYTIQNQLRWNLKAMTSAKLSLILTFTTIVFTFIFVVGFDWGVSGALLAQLIATCLSLSLGYYWTRDSFVFKLERDKLKQMLYFSLPLVPSSVGVVAALYVDRIAVKQLLSMSDLGVFGVGYRIASIVSLLMVGFQSALTPLIYMHHKEENTPNSIAYIFRIFIVFALMVFVGLSVFSREIIMLLTPDGYHEAASIVPPMVFGVLLWQMYIFAPGLSLAKKTITIGILNVVSALLNLVLNYVLIPMLGILGAALATFLSAAVVFLLYMFYSQKYYYVPHNWKSIIPGVLIIILLVYFSMFIGLWTGIVEFVIKLSVLLMAFISLIGVKMITMDDFLVLKVKAKQALRKFSNS